MIPVEEIERRRGRASRSPNTVQEFVVASGLGSSSEYDGNVPDVSVTSRAPIVAPSEAPLPASLESVSSGAGGTPGQERGAADQNPSEMGGTMSTEASPTPPRNAAGTCGEIMPSAMLTQRDGEEGRGTHNAPTPQLRRSDTPEAQRERARALVQASQRHLLMPPGWYQAVVTSARGSQTSERPSAREQGRPVMARSASQPALAPESPARPEVRQARIQELLCHLGEPCPVDVARLEARRQQATERHVQRQPELSVTSSSRPTSSGSAASSSSGLPRRRGRSLIELLQLEPEWRPLDAVVPANVAQPAAAADLDALLARMPAASATACGRHGAAGDVCIICLEVPVEGEVLTTLPCCHWYHRECIREWLVHSPLCPLCKGYAVGCDGG